jgi:hypothetical protein
MSIDLEYAIRKDIRNNPLVRQTDARQKHDFYRILLLVLLTVGTLLFSGLWQNNIQLAGIDIEVLRKQVESERATNRLLRLNLEAERAPALVERAAQAIGMRQPTLDEALVIERAYESSPDGTIVARAD